LENIDKAFSRRFNYKIEFKRPDEAQRVELWKKMLPLDAPYEKDFDPLPLSKYALTGGQINLIVKNTAYKVAVRENPLFTQEDFIQEIQREKDANFDSEKSVGFINK